MTSTRPRSRQATHSVERHTRSVKQGWAGALAGVLAATAGIGVGEAVGAMTRPEAAPLVVVGTRFIQATPHWLEKFAIDLFATHDKDALRVGVAIVVVLLSAVAGWRATKRIGEGLGFVGAFGAFGLFCALTVHAHRASDVVPTIVATLVSAVVLTVLIDVITGSSRLMRRHASASPVRPVQPTARVGVADRRLFLTASAATAAGAALFGFGGRAAQHHRFDAARSRAEVVIPPAAEPATALPAGADLGKSPVPFQTPNKDFYRIDTAYTIPQIDADTWTLKIHGMVDKPVYYKLADLLAMPLIERWITMMCVSYEVGGDLIGTALFRGVPLAPLLKAAGVQAGADQLVSRSHDGMTIGTPVATVMDGRDAMLAVGMNGEALPVAHGFPVRMLVPGLYGYVSACKWIQDIEVTTFAKYDAYWVQQGWVPELPIQLGSRIDTPNSGKKVKVGQPVAIAGVAWHQHVGVSKVEVKIEDADWVEARLGTVPSVDTWRQWTLPWTPPAAGQYRVTVRAYDAKGLAQDTTTREPYPGAASGLHSVGVTAT